MKPKSRFAVGVLTLALVTGGVPSFGSRAHALPPTPSAAEANVRDAEARLAAGRQQGGGMVGAINNLGKEQQTAEQKSVLRRLLDAAISAWRSFMSWLSSIFSDPTKSAEERAAAQRQFDEAARILAAREAERAALDAGGAAGSGVTPGAAGSTSTGTGTTAGTRPAGTTGGTAGAGLAPGATGSGTTGTAGTAPTSTTPGSAGTGVRTPTVPGGVTAGTGNAGTGTTTGGATTRPGGTNGGVNSGTLPGGSLGGSNPGGSYDPGGTYEPGIGTPGGEIPGGEIPGGLPEGVPGGIGTNTGTVGPGGTGSTGSTGSDAAGSIGGTRPGAGSSGLPTGGLGEDPTDPTGMGTGAGADRSGVGPGGTSATGSGVTGPGASGVDGVPGTPGSGVVGPDGTPLNPDDPNNPANGLPTGPGGGFFGGGSGGTGGSGGVDPGASGPGGIGGPTGAGGPTTNGTGGAGGTSGTPTGSSDAADAGVKKKATGLLVLLPRTQAAVAPNTNANAPAAAERSPKVLKEMIKKLDAEVERLRRQPTGIEGSHKPAVGGPVDVWVVENWKTPKKAKRYLVTFAKPEDVEALRAKSGATASLEGLAKSLTGAFELNEAKVIAVLDRPTTPEDEVVTPGSGEKAPEPPAPAPSGEEQPAKPTEGSKEDDLFGDDD